MFTVQEAEKIILENTQNYGSETLHFSAVQGRVLAENIYADRDFPPFNRVTMDGICIDYQALARGIRIFSNKATQAAGVTPIDIENDTECIEIMTGAALPMSCDTVIRYEDLEIKGDEITVLIENVKQGQNVHRKGEDKQKNDILVAENQVITPAIIQIAVSVGKSFLQVKKMPRVVVISSGDELVETDEIPNLYQIRRSNDYTLQAALKKNNLEADVFHIADNQFFINKKINECLQKYDVLILTGGISAGKFDYLPEALERLGVKKLFHKVAQKPGKPFWFGKTENNVLVFAFPGNPVSMFMCFYRYFIPWLNASLGLKMLVKHAILSKKYTFKPDLHFFLQVKIHQNEQAQLVATPLEGNGSGDFTNLLQSDAFMELAAEKTDFEQGEILRIWEF